MFLRRPVISRNLCRARSSPARPPSSRSFRLLALVFNSSWRQQRGCQTCRGPGGSTANQHDTPESKQVKQQAKPILVLGARNLGKDPAPRSETALVDVFLCRRRASMTTTYLSL